jgi:hypothetical protein
MCTEYSLNNTRIIIIYALGLEMLPWVVLALPTPEWAAPAVILKLNDLASTG